MRPPGRWAPVDLKRKGPLQSAGTHDHDPFCAATHLRVLTDRLKVAPVPVMTYQRRNVALLPPSTTFLSEVTLCVDFEPT